MRGLEAGEKHQVLLGITGSGKTFTIANVIQRSGKPTLILAPNKTLAAQLYGEMRELFPEQRGRSTSSATTTTTSPRRTSRRATRTSRRTRSSTTQIDRMRHAATHALLSRRDVIIVASVSCIYGIGCAESYHGLLIELESRRGVPARRPAAHARRHPVRAQRRRLPPRHVPRARRRRRGLPGLRGETRDPHRVLRRRDRGDQGGRSAARQACKGTLERYAIYPGSHYVTPQEQMRRAIDGDPRGAARAARLLRQGGALPREAAPRAAHACTTSR